MVRERVEWAWESVEEGMGHVGKGGVDDNYSIDVSLMWLLLSTSLLSLVWVRRQEEGGEGRCVNPMPSSPLSITKATLSLTEPSPSPHLCPPCQGNEENGDEDNDEHHLSLSSSLLSSFSSQGG